MKLKSLPAFTFGAVAAIFVAIAWTKYFSSDAVDWLPRANRSTMPGRREYTLPLNNPDVVSGSSAVHMEANDLVVGVTVHGLSRAYPWWILSNYHVVNDTLITNTAGKIPVYVGLCEQCSGAGAFIPTIDELPSRPLTFQISGIRAGTFEITDIQTLSHWHPFSGEALDGPLKGKELAPIPFVLDRWDNWLDKHPDTDVVLGSMQMRRRPHGMSHGASIGHPHLPDFFAMVANLDDRRLPSNELVYGLVVDRIGSTIAIRLSDVKDLPFLEFEFKGMPLLLCRTGEYGVRVFVRELNGKPLRFKMHSESPFLLTDQSGTVWNEMGEAVGPELNQSMQLRLARGYLTEWYEWVSKEPKTELFNPIRNTDVDLRNLTIHAADGSLFPLASLTGSYTVLVFGCGTSPLLEANIAELETVYRDYRNRGVQFFLVYKYLAHPGRTGFVPPMTMEERITQSQMATNRLGCSIPWLCDNMSNEFADALNAGADSELIVDKSGKILQVRNWCDPTQLRRDLSNLVGPVDHPTSAKDNVLKRSHKVPSAPKNVVPPITAPASMIPLQSHPQASNRPYFVKLLVEAEPGLLKTGTGKIYLGCYLDSMYDVYWNNQLEQLHFEVVSDSGIDVEPTTGRASTSDEPRDIDPREFLISVNKANLAAKLRVIVSYFVCNDVKPFREQVTQTYDVTLARDFHVGTRWPRLEPQYRKGDVVAKILEFDTDANGVLALDEISPNLRPNYEPFDANADGQIDADEMRQVELQLLRRQNYQW